MTVLLPFGLAAFAMRLLWRGCMKERHWDQPMVTISSGQGGGDLQKPLSAHEVGLEARSQRITPPGDAGRVETRTPQQRIVKHRAKRCACGQLIGDGPTNDGEDLGQRQTILGKEPIGGTPIVELRSGSGQQAGHGVASETKQGTQREGLRAVGDAALVEGGEAFVPELLEAGEDAGGVFFKTEGGGSRRRSASRVLSSMIHSTVSPRENSIAWATAEGKLMYHCSLALRWMS